MRIGARRELGLRIKAQQPALQKRDSVHRPYLLARVLLVATACGFLITSDNSPAAGSLAPIDDDPNFSAVTPEAQDGTGNDQGIYLPALASPGSEVVGTVTSDATSGPTTFYVGAVDSAGATRYWKSTTDTNGRFHFRLPSPPGGLTTLVVFKHFDTEARPDRGAATVVSAKPMQIGDMRPVIGYAASGPTIIEGNTSYQRGGFAQGIVQLHTRALDPVNSRILLDGSTADIDTLAASDTSIVGRLHDSAALGRRLMSIQSGSRRTNGFNTYVIALTFSELTPLNPGDVEPLSLQAAGLGKDPAVAEFEVLGAASLADGSPSATVPIVDGRSQVTLRGQRSGQIQIRVTIDVQVPLVSVNADSAQHK